MCRFRSGIILKTRVVIAQEDNDSHSDLLDEIGIEDTTENAMTKFVRAELVPDNDEWWTDPDTWKICIDQDITPDWFEEDREKYIADFRQTVKAWWEKHVLVDQKIEELSSGYYRLKRCEVKRLLKDVKALLNDSRVGKMLGSSQVGEMWGSSQVGKMLGSSTARDFKSYPKMKILVSNEGDMELVRHENKGRESDG